MADRMSIIIFSGTVDKLMAASILTTGGAALEFTFLLDEWLRKRGLRNRIEIHYLYPLPRVFPIETVAEVVTPLLEERNIQSTIFFNAETVDTERKIISSLAW